MSQATENYHGTQNSDSDFEVRSESDFDIRSSSGISQTSTIRGMTVGRSGSFMSDLSDYVGWYQNYRLVD